MIVLASAGAVVVIAYAVLAVRARRWPLARAVAFVSGVAIAVACFGPDPSSLAMHMAQHAIAVTIAAPLVVLGDPGLLGLRSTPARWRRRLAGCLRRLPLRQPALLWAAFVATQLAFHVTPLFDAALRIAWLHHLEHALLFVTAVGFWLPVIGHAPGVRRLSPQARAGYLILALPATDASALWLALQGHPAAAAAMAIAMLPLAAAAVGTAWSALESEERRRSRMDVTYAR